MKSNNRKIAALLAGKKLPPKEVRAVRSVIHNRRKLITPFHVEGTPFPVGRKQVFLPNFEIALLRNPKNPPHWAEFQVPLNINKLDLRDYLYHAYGIHARAIRSKIDQPEITNRAGMHKNEESWYRPRSTKRMVVEMDEPFVWPEEPQDMEKWNKSQNDSFKKIQDEVAEDLGRREHTLTNDDMAAIMASRAELAERLVRGEAKWKEDRVFRDSEPSRISIDTAKKQFRRRAYLGAFDKLPKNAAV